MVPRKQRRLERERRTIRVMIDLFCRDHHRPAGVLCGECERLLVYAMERIDKCPYHDDKPTCARCPIHCYKPEMREQIRRVMRYGGPRMLRTHPVLTVLHYYDELTRPDVDRVSANDRSGRKRTA